MAIAANLAGFQHPTVPSSPPADQAVGPNFERFDPTAPAPEQPVIGQAALTGSPNRPGGSRYEGPRTGAQGAPGLTNTLGGQPLLSTSDRIHRAPGAYTPARSRTRQLIKGVGQTGPSSLGLAQTVAQATRTKNPPAGQDLLSMIAGLTG